MPRAAASWSGRLRWLGWQRCPAPSGGGGAGGSGGAGGPGVSVSFSGEVGSFDATVLKADDAAALERWLGDNGYEVSAEALAIIASYVEQKKHFVALKLQKDKPTGEITPIVMRYAGATPCVPLRLTAVASAEDLRVNVWGARPRARGAGEFSRVELNLGHVASEAQPPTTRPRHAPPTRAGGGAYVTNYAGSARLFDGAVWSDGRYGLETIRAAEIPDAVEAILADRIHAMRSCSPSCAGIFPCRSRWPTSPSAKACSGPGCAPTGCVSPKRSRPSTPWRWRTISTR